MTQCMALGWSLGGAKQAAAYSNRGAILHAGNSSAPDAKLVNGRNQIVGVWCDRRISNRRMKGDVLGIII